MAQFRVKAFDRSMFPALYRCADDASTNAQRCHLRWLSANLVFLILGAIVGSITPTDVGHRQMVRWTAAICFFLALATTILLASRKWDRAWYAGRAVAESVKSLTWKFMAGADPFPTTLESVEAVERFTNSLRELLHEHRHLAAALSDGEARAEQVTSHMTDLRVAAVGVIRDVYRAQRVDEQQTWYADKSVQNRAHYNRWFVLLVLLQGCAGTTAILLALHPTTSWRALAVFSTIASATLAWSQAKRFQELAQAYGFAAQELSLISARAPYVLDRVQLARFVNDAETAISREHSTWVARRETE